MLLVAKLRKKNEPTKLWTRFLGAFAEEIGLFAETIATGIKLLGAVRRQRSVF